MKYIFFVMNKFAAHKIILGIFLMNLLFLSACGQSGGLYLPGKQPQETIHKNM